MSFARVHGLNQNLVWFRQTYQSLDMHAFRGDLAVPHDCVLTLKECRSVHCDVMERRWIASITVTLQTTAFHNLSVAGRPTVGARDVRHLSSRGDSDQNFGRVTVLVGDVRGLLSDRERWLLDRALGSIDDDSGCCVASFESTRCKHHAYQYSRSLTQAYTQCGSNDLPVAALLFLIPLRLHAFLSFPFPSFRYTLHGWPIMLASRNLKYSNVRDYEYD